MSCRSLKPAAGESIPMIGAKQDTTCTNIWTSHYTFAVPKILGSSRFFKAPGPRLGKLADNITSLPPTFDYMPSQHENIPTQQFTMGLTINLYPACNAGPAALPTACESLNISLKRPKSPSKDARASDKFTSKSVGFGKNTSSMSDTTSISTSVEPVFKRFTT